MVRCLTFNHIAFERHLVRNSSEICLPSVPHDQLLAEVGSDSEGYANTFDAVHCEDYSAGLVGLWRKPPRGLTSNPYCLS